MDENFNEAGEFRYGKFSYERVQNLARKCDKFVLDNDEGELVCKGLKTCYNCLFRRWSADSFTCLKRANSV